MSCRYLTPANDLLADPTEVGNLDDMTIQWLLRQGVSIDAIAGPLALRSGRVVFDPYDRRYQTNPLGEFVMIIAVMADPETTMLDLQAVDLIAWSPKSGRIAARHGKAFALGEEQIGIDGLGTTGLPVLVHRSPLGWLRQGRRGIVIVNRTTAAFALAGLILEAEDDDHRRSLLRQLLPIAPRIVVSSRRAAA